MSLFRKHTILTDREIELLLSGFDSGSEEHGDLERFVAELAAIKSRSPREQGSMATTLAALARASRPPRSTSRPRRAMRRLVAVAASTALLMAMSGVAMAADDAAPGDLLYGVDRAFEMIGIGDGGVEERIAEFDLLMARGERDEAFKLLEEFVDSAEGDEAAEAQEHLEAAQPTSTPKSDVANDDVPDLHEFIEDNQGKGVGDDGRDFGQGVADIISNRDKDLPDQANENRPETPGDNSNSDPGPPDHAGAKTDPPTAPNSDADVVSGPDRGADTENNDNPGNSNPGAPDNAGKKDK